mgnify:CR=1 FL=1
MAWTGSRSHAPFARHPNFCGERGSEYEVSSWPCDLTRRAARALYFAIHRASVPIRSWSRALKICLGRRTVGYIPFRFHHPSSHADTSAGSVMEQGFLPFVLLSFCGICRKQKVPSGNERAVTELAQQSLVIFDVSEVKLLIFT